MNYYYGIIISIQPECWAFPIGRCCRWIRPEAAIRWRGSTPLWRGWDLHLGTGTQLRDLLKQQSKNN